MPKFLADARRYRPTATWLVTGFGAVASHWTVWRLLDQLGQAQPARIAVARTAAWKLVWAP